MRTSFAASAAALLLSAAAANAAVPEDFSAAISPIQAGIDLFAITDSGTSLIAGSPFTPTKLPPGFPEGLQVVPVMAQLSTEHHYLYVVYEGMGSGNPNILIQYAVQPTGLAENWAVYTDFNGSNDLNHVAYLEALVATDNEIIVYNHYPWGPTAEIFNSAGAVLAKAASSPSGEPVLQSVSVDPAGHFYYACFHNNSQAYVSIFDLATAKLIAKQTNPTFVAGECD